jgi:HD superfamily phosphohydrolase
MRLNKVINDPIYEFIPIPDEIILSLIDHPYFQRLTRIKQLGFSYLVFPGAHHTRFAHSLGAMYLMQRALEQLNEQSIYIDDKTYLSSLIAILLHDIGHGPFSHTLEALLADNISHEFITNLAMKKLEKSYGEPLNIARQIFNDSFPVKFYHQLVSSQLDMDRLDYLTRDSFYTGVSEGIINTQRIIYMLTLTADGDLGILAKGIYSIEKFIIARKIMYWQVYYHKTTMAADEMLYQVIKRAKYLSQNGDKIPATEPLEYFLKYNDKKFSEDDLDVFMQLDDYDVMTALKMWCDHDDIILQLLSRKLLNRNLFRCIIQNNNPITETERMKILKQKILKNYKIDKNDLHYLISIREIENQAYTPLKDQINLVYKNGEVKDISSVSDQFNTELFPNDTMKYFLFYPKEIE